MASNALISHLSTYLKGIAMGAADVVPGVSGGTIAFITGIYETLIGTIHKLDLGLFKHWKNHGFKAMWSHYNFGFLAVLFLGIATSIFSLAKIITHLLETHPVLVWSFFFGLIVASIIYVGKQIDAWRLPVILALIAGAVVSYYITIAEPIAAQDSLWFMALAGFIAIIAMILPGLSGAFILLLLGAYEPVIGAISGVIDGLTGEADLMWDSFLKLTIFAIGAIAGLKAFSGILNWMFNNYKTITLAVLTGFMLGALNKVWPWKEVITTRINSEGLEVPLLEKSISPSNFEGDPQIMGAVIAAVAGCALILGFEWLAKRKSATADGKGA